MRIEQPGHSAIIRWAAAFALLAAVVCLEPGRVSAAPATRTWTGAGANNSWMTNANWDSAAPNPGDHLIFPPVAARKANSNNFPNFTAFESITFLGSGYTISGNRAVVNDKVFNSAEGTNTLSFIIDGTAELRNGAGTLNLMAANSHSGTNFILGGTVVAGHNNAFGEFGAIVDFFEGTLTVASGIDIPNPLIVGGPTVPVVQGLGAAEWSGTIDLADDTQFDAGPGAVFELSGPIEGPLGFAKSGPGTLILSEVNTYLGAVVVQQGTLRITREEAFGAGIGGTRVLAGATLALDGADAMDEPIEIEGGGFAALGALRSMQAIVHVADLTATDDATIRVDAGTLRLPNGLDHELGTNFVTKSGQGKLEIEGHGTYSEQLVVTGGTLAVRGTLDADVEVQAGILVGEGSIGRLDLLGGRVEPGVSGSGTLKVNGVAYLGPASTASFGIDSQNDYAQLWVTGTVILDSGVLEVTGDGDVIAAAGVTLIRNDSGAPVNGVFNGRQEGDTVALGGNDFRLSYFGGQAPLNDVVLTSLGGAEPADTGVQISPLPATVPTGSEIAVAYTVFNRGVANVSQVELRMAIRAGLGFVSFTAQPGWACLAPNVGQSGNVVCTRASWAPTGPISGTQFTVTMKVLAQPNALQLIDAILEHGGVEGVAADNAASRFVTVGPADPRPFKLRILLAARDGAQ